MTRIAIQTCQKSDKWSPKALKGLRIRKRRGEEWTATDKTQEGVAQWQPSRKRLVAGAVQLASARCYPMPAQSPAGGQARASSDGGMLWHDCYSFPMQYSSLGRSLWFCMELQCGPAAKCAQGSPPRSRDLPLIEYR